MLTKHYNQTPPITLHTLSQLSDLQQTPTQCFAIGIEPVFILVTGTKHLARTYLLSPHGVSIDACQQLHIDINNAWHDQIKVLRCLYAPQQNQEQPLFFSTMRLIIKAIRTDARDALFALCTKFQSRKIQQQRFIDMPMIQQSIAKAYVWLDLAKPLDTIPHHDHQLDDLAAHWYALLKCTELLCQLNGANSLAQHGYRDLYWIAFVYSQLFKRGAL